MTTKTTRTGRTIITAGMLAVMLIFTSCFGPFNATARLKTWNREIENRWAGEGVYVLFSAAWIYRVFFIADAFIFNSIEFWGGDNPVEPPSPERVKALRDKDDARAAEAKGESKSQ